jgi:HlyD family secretion protein
MKKKIVFILVAAVLVLLASFFLKKNEKAAYSTVPVMRGKIVSAVSATGKVIAANLVNVGTQISGTISKVKVEPNDIVKKGQVLAELDREKLLARLSEAEASVAAAQALVRKAGAELQRSRADFERIRELFGKGLVSRSEFDAGSQESESAEALLEQARAELRNASAAKKAVEDDLEKSIIRSPIDGVVLSVNVEEGQTVAASFQTPILLSVADLRDMEVHAFVDEADMGRVREGQNAIFLIDAYPEREFEAVVQKVYYSPTIEQNVVTYETVLKVDNREMLLRHGMTANIRVVIAQKDDVLLIPNKALRVRIETSEAVKDAAKGPGAWVLEGKRPVRRQLKTGISDEENTEVAEGLGEGDLVITETPAPDGRSQGRTRRPFGF